MMRSALTESFDAATRDLGLLDALRRLVEELELVALDVRRDLARDFVDAAALTDRVRACVLIDDRQSIEGLLLDAAECLRELPELEVIERVWRWAG